MLMRREDRRAQRGCSDIGPACGQPPTPACGTHSFSERTPTRLPVPRPPSISHLWGWGSTVSTLLRPSQASSDLGLTRWPSECAGRRGRGRRPPETLRVIMAFLLPGRSPVGLWARPTWTLSVQRYPRPGVGGTPTRCVPPSARRGARPRLDPGPPGDVSPTSTRVDLSPGRRSPHPGEAGSAGGESKSKHD